MYLIPLNQIESVDLVIHALRAAGGEADCTMCPVRKVCTRQCLAVAEGIQQMIIAGTLPAMEKLLSESDEEPPDKPDGGGSGPKLRVIK